MVRAAIWVLPDGRYCQVRLTFSRRSMYLRQRSQFQNPSSIVASRWHGFEVEAVQAFDGSGTSWSASKIRLLDHAAFADQLATDQFGQGEQV